MRTSFRAMAPSNLGLHATEIATLKLDDLDWRAAEVVVHGKGRRDGRLPLPADVGEAIAAWLQHGRAKTTSREVFLSVQAPIMALGRGGVGSIVRHACVRAGVPQAHDLAVAVQRLEPSADIVQGPDTASVRVFAEVTGVGVCRHLVQGHPLATTSDEERDVWLLDRTRLDVVRLAHHNIRCS